MGLLGKWGVPRFLRPLGARNAFFLCCGTGFWGTGGERQPGGLLGQRPKATWRCAERKRVPCGHLGQRPKAT